MKQLSIGTVCTTLAFVAIALVTTAFVTIDWSDEPNASAPSSAAVATTQSAPAAAAQAKPLTVESLAWMSGHWETPAGATQIDEHWTHVAGGSMLGTSRTVANGKMVFFEFLRLETRGDAVYYVAQPGGSQPTPFKLVSVDGEKAVFENLQHDFPKRILYEREAGGGLFARVEGDGSEPEKAQEFRYKPRTAK